MDMKKILTGFLIVGSVLFLCATGYAQQKEMKGRHQYEGKGDDGVTAPENVDESVFDPGERGVQNQNQDEGPGQRVRRRVRAHGPDGAPRSGQIGNQPSPPEQDGQVQGAGPKARPKKKEALSATPKKKSQRAPQRRW